MLVSLSQYQSLSTKPGIYLFLDEKGKILYVGKAKNLKKRVSSYFLKNIELGTKTRTLVSQIVKIRTITVNSEIEAFLLEANYIKKHKPKYNIKLTDDKAYPLIRITIKDAYPKVLVARKAQDKKSIYFGPFPNATYALRLTLKTIRRIFPYQSVLNHPKKLCLYYHLGLCPCPEVLNDKGYKTNISHLIDFLNGKTKKVIKDLKVERGRLRRLEEFEKASLIQKKLDAIELITGQFYKTEFSSKGRPASGWDYKVNPNLTEDLLKNQLEKLQECLNQNGVIVKRLERIECYDISNTSGKQATGSMVVLINGEIDLSLYRRFKIRNSYVGPDDFAMMQEVLQRRMKHTDWSMPDLIIVDGGRGQVSSAMKILKEEKINIPVIGLAKREETIIIPTRRHSGKRSASRISSTNHFIEIFLPKDSPALHLIMKLRDEAHRFAIFYHRKLRSKQLIH